MIFTELPTEILDEVIKHTLPEGFESVALACKRLFARCVPLIQRHRQLCLRFRTFNYYIRPHAPSITSEPEMKSIEYYFRPDGQDLSLTCASDLIMLIAAEPVVARYIRTATFKHDSLHLRRQLPKSMPSIQDGGAVVDLFANSAYLKEANIDWKEYYTALEADVRECRYSQNGAAFLLTLLPNVKEIILPRAWKRDGSTEKLIDVIVDKARQSACSLTHLTNFKLGVVGNTDERFELSWASPFLALPHMRSFYGPSCLAMGDLPRSLGFQGSHYIAATLQTAHFVGCSIDDVGIADFLRHTPSLKTLKYVHETKDGSPTQDWDICKFVNAVEREAGKHLLQFSVTIGNIAGSIVPGAASIRGFHRLEMLEFPLQLVMCNIATAAASQTLNQSDVFSDLIPNSVAQLALISEGTEHHEEALKTLFHHIHWAHVNQLSALQEIRITCPKSAEGSYKDQCDRVVREAKDKGIEARLNLWPACYNFSWDVEH